MNHRGYVPPGWPLFFLVVISLASLTFPVHAVALSDLAVESIWLEDASQVGQPVSQLSPGQSFNIIVTIKNIGQDTASAYYLDAYYDSDYGRGGPDNIAPGEIQTWYVGPLTAQAGSHTTKWVVDPDNQIAEVDESNNLKEYAFTIGLQTTNTTTTTTNSTTSNSTTTSTTETRITTTTVSSSTSSTFSSTTNSASTTLPPVTVSIIVTADPSGSIVVDGTTYTLPQTFTWVPGSSHIISANSPVSGALGTQYVWTSWADGGDQSRTITAPSYPTTYTANYQTQYQVTFAVNPSGGGAITVDGQPSVTSWYDDGAVVSVQASSNAGYVFSSWGSDAASIVFVGSASPSISVTIHGAGTVTANFLLQDATPPVITSTVSPSANIDGWNSGPVTVSWSVSDSESGIVSSTACTTTTVSAETPLAGTTLTCTATNSAGLSNSASVTVKIDLTAPALTLPSPTVEATGSSGALVSYDASASDPLSGIDTFSCTPPSGSTFPISTTTVSCSTTDKAGNTATGTFTVTVLPVQDKTAPLVTVPADISVEASGPTGAVVTFTASALDAVDGSLAPTCTPSSGSMFALGSTKVTCSVADKAGNTGSASFNVTVVDKTPPTLKIPGDMTVQATSPGAVVTFSASASDLVDGSVLVTCTPASGFTFPVGTTTVACSATDKAGNPASGSFKVTVSPSSSTITVTVKLLDSSTNGLSGGMVQYYSGGWRSFGTTGSDGAVSMALPPGTYNFQISWAGASQQKSQNVATNPNVVFKTTLVTMKLLSSTNTELNGGAQYYAGGWKTFGGGTATATMELLPITYTFQVSWAGASQQKSQNVATNPNVVFQTVQVHSDSGKCTSYHASGWRTFTQDMELLPGTYTFRFSDKTANTSYTLVVGAMKHIH